MTVVENVTAKRTSDIREQGNSDGQRESRNFLRALCSYQCVLLTTTAMGAAAITEGAGWLAMKRFGRAVMSGVLLAGMVAPVAASAQGPRPGQYAGSYYGTVHNDHQYARGYGDRGYGNHVYRVDERYRNDGYRGGYYVNSYRNDGAYYYGDRYNGVGPGTGAVIGGAAGVVLGGLLGGGKGALIGGAAGAGIGAVAGAANKDAHDRRYYGYGY